MKCSCRKKDLEVPRSICWKCEKPVCADCKRLVVLPGENHFTTVCSKCFTNISKNNYPHKAHSE